MRCGDSLTQVWLIDAAGSSPVGSFFYMLDHYINSGNKQVDYENETL